jgi:putative transposase
MPNHFHGIIIIGENECNCRDVMHHVSTSSNKNNNINPNQNQFGPQRNNLASVIRGFKSAVTKQARLINPDFAWQSRFYDRIIRNEKEFYKVKQYIINNPNNWDNDRNNQDGLLT